MSPLLFNIYMNGVVKKVNAKMLGIGLFLVNSDDKETHQLGAITEG